MKKKLNLRRQCCALSLAATVLLTLFSALTASAAVGSPTVTLSVATVADTSVLLSWTTARLSGVSSYDVVYGISQTSLNSRITVGLVTSRTVTGLSPSTAYFFQVVASTRKGTVYSNVVSATTDGLIIVEVTLAPSNLSATAASSNQINLAWTDNSSNETGFTVERATVATGPFAQVATLAAGVVSWSNTGLQGSTSYYYRVCAYNSAGSSTYSNTALATTSPPPVTIPAAPSNLSATATSSSQINLAWIDNSSNETGFTVERATVATGPFAQVATLAAGVVSWSNTGLQGSTSYYYRVCASNSAGNSAYSNTASATTLSAVTIPAMPSNMAATAAASSQINLTWTDNSTNETGFKIERSLSASSGFAQIATLGPGVVSYSDATGLSASTAYYYRVCAYNSAGSSTYSNTASATTLSGGPSAPSGLSGAVISDTQINLFWTDNSTNETGFKIERSLSASSGFVQIAAPGANVTTYQNTGLSEKTTYYYRVCAYNSGGNSSYSSGLFCTTMLKAPTNLTATAISSAETDLTWIDNSSQETNYVVERSVGGTWFILATLAANTASYVDNSCQAATTYSYRVKAAGSTSNYSNVVTVTTPSVPSINLGWIGQTPAMGDAVKVAMSGNIAYVTCTTGLLVVDIYDQSRPLIIGSLNLPNAYDITITGSIALVTAGATLCTVSITNPAQPELLGSVSLPDWGYSVAQFGSTKASVACYSAGMVVVDLINPTAPRIVGSVDTPGQAYGVCVSGNVAVVADGTGGVADVDISNPAAPRIVGTLATAYPAKDVEIANGYAYVAATSSGLLSVNISNPASPYLVGKAASNGSAVGVSLIGAYAYVSSAGATTANNGLQIYNISSGVPASVSFLWVPGYFRGGLAAGAGIVCFAAGWGGLTTIDTASPASPAIMGSMPQATQTTAVAANSTTLFATTRSSTQSYLHTFDVTNAAAPVQIGSLPLGIPLDIALDAYGYVYVTDGTTLKVVSAANPANPTLVYTLALPDYGYGITVSGTTAYVACYQAGLVVVDISNPASPRIVGSVDTPGYAYAVAVAGTTAIVADYNSVLTADVSNKLSPRVLGALPSASPVMDVQVSGGYAFAVASAGGVLAVSIANPSSPQLVGQAASKGSAMGLAVSGGTLFVANCSANVLYNGLEAYDISVPSAPREVSFLASPPGKYSRAVAVCGSNAFLTSDMHVVDIAQF